MIIIAGTVDIDPEQRAKALDAARPLIDGALTQEGCEFYAWCIDPTTPGRIYVYERWESQEALASHFEGPHYLAMRNTIAAHGLRGADVLKYEIGRAEPVYDPTGTPRADFFTET